MLQTIQTGYRLQPPCQNGPCQKQTQQHENHAGQDVTNIQHDFVQCVLCYRFVSLNQSRFGTLNHFFRSGKPQQINIYWKRNIQLNALTLSENSLYYFMLQIRIFALANPTLTQHLLKKKNKIKCLNSYKTNMFSMYFLVQFCPRFFILIYLSGIPSPLARGVHY